MITGRFLAKQSLIVASILTISAILGFLRESAIAYQFGASAEMDAYLVAMIIPMLFINLIKGSITNTFITVYSGYVAEGNIEEGWRMTNILLTILGLIVLGMILIGMVKTIWLVNLVAPGYGGEQLALTVKLTRILLPSMFFGTLMGVLVGINNVNHSFIAPSIIGVVANIIMILSVFLLGYWWGVYGLAIGSLVGIIVQFLIQLPSANRHGLNFRLEIDLRNPGLQETLRLVTPFVLSAAAIQVNMIVDRTLATGLPEGVVSSLYFANKLLFLPQNIFTGAVGMVVFPLLTSAASRGDWGDLINGFQRSVRLLSLVLLPAGFGIFVLRLPLVQLIFEHGAFTSESTRLTAGTVGYFLGALYFAGMVSMIVYVLFALKKMALAVGTSIIGVGVNIGLSLWFIHPLQQKGLALANSLSALVNLCLLIISFYVVLRREGIKSNPYRGLLRFLGKVSFAVAGMSFSVVGYLRLLEDYNGKFGLIITVFSSTVVGIVVYSVLLYLFRIDEVHKGAVIIARKVQNRYLSNK